jgi:hypothetical protein
MNKDFQDFHLNDFFRCNNSFINIFNMVGLINSFKSSKFLDNFNFPIIIKDKEESWLKGPRMFYRKVKYEQNDLLCILLQRFFF